MDVTTRVDRPTAMDNPIKPYPWGSTTALAALQGRTPTGAPEAELWMGAHPDGPSRLHLPDGSTPDLPAVLAADPAGVLGPHVVDTFGPRLPYLFKVLAIDAPLSVQVHPDATRARDVFDHGTGIDGHRYSDPYPKPEMLYALAPIDALCGFRDADTARAFFSLLDGARCARVAALLDPAKPGGEQILAAFTALVTWPADDRAALAAEVAASARRLLDADGTAPDGTAPDGPLADADLREALELALDLTGRYPHDPMVTAPFILQLVHLAPGDTLFVPAGAPHAYLKGVGIEVMAGSDNVLRAGLTPKPVAVGELLHVLDVTSAPVLDPARHELSAHEVAWRPGALEFQLVRARLDGAEVALADLDGPQIALCSRGEITVTGASGSCTVTAGASVFVPAGQGPLRARGTGELFRAAVPPTA